jgi:hypothetical protein
MKKNIVLLFSSILFVLVLFELFLRFSNYEPWIRTAPGTYANQKHRLAEPHSEFGWVLNRQEPVPHKQLMDRIDVIYYANKEGFRDSGWSGLKDIDPNGQNILVFGDSQTFGYGVEEWERFSNRVGSILTPDYNVYNLAMAGWGVDQMYLAFKKYVPLFNPEIVIIAYINSDLLRSLQAFALNIRVKKPSFEVKNDVLKVRNKENLNMVEKYQNKISKEVYLVNFFYKNFYRHYYSRILNEKFIEEVIKTANDRNIKLVFVRIPSKLEVSPNNHLHNKMQRFSRRIYYSFFGLQTILTKESQIFIDPTEIMREMSANKKVNFYFPVDFHLNKNGHELIAELVMKKISEIDGKINLR